MARKPTPIALADDGSMTLEQAFGIVVRRRRLELKLRLIDLEGDNEYDWPYFSMLEHGKTVPSIKALVHIAKKLGCKPGELIDEAWEMLGGQ